MEMVVTSFGGMCGYGQLLTYLSLFSYITLSTSVGHDLTELRNKVSKMKINPRGNLWATGHFMGKKSISDSQVVDSQSSFESKMKQLQTATNTERNPGDVTHVIAQKALKGTLQDALQDQRERQDSVKRDKDFVMEV